MCGAIKLGHGEVGLGYDFSGTDKAIVFYDIYDKRGKYAVGEIFDATKVMTAPIGRIEFVNQEGLDALIDSLVALKTTFEAQTCKSAC